MAAMGGPVVGAVGGPVGGPVGGQRDVGGHDVDGHGADAQRSSTVPAVVGDGAEASAEDDRYARALGERLRRVRQQQGLSLHHVEQRSAGALKASVVGAYERGERAVSITRLHQLAGFYRVPVGELLPDAAGRRPVVHQEGGELVIDLVALEARGGEEPALVRYADSIRARRGDYNGRVLTVRASDLETLAAVLDASPEELRARLAAAGIAR